MADEKDDSVVGELVAKSDEPPQISPPQTKAPVQFNQQVNVYQQIPPSAWEKLSADQIVDLSKDMLKAMDATDNRQFEYAMSQARNGQTARLRTTIFGSLITVVGFGLTSYLAMNGHEMIALTISLPLATILAIVVGNKILGSE